MKGINSEEYITNYIIILEEKLKFELKSSGSWDNFIDILKLITSAMSTIIKSNMFKKILTDLILSYLTTYLVKYIIDSRNHSVIAKLIILILEIFLLFKINEDDIDK